MNNLKSIFTILAFLSAIATNAQKECEDHHDHDIEHHHKKTECADSHHSHNNQSLELSPSALTSIGIKYAHPTKRKMASTMVLMGRMELSSDARLVAPSPVPGIISLKVKEFTRVKKGDVLFTIESPSIKSLSNEIEVLEKRLEVYRKLNTANAEIESALKLKIAEKAALIGKAEESKGMITVRAGADAMIENVNTPDSSWMETGDAAVSLVRPQLLRFRSLLPASEAAKLTDGLKILCAGKEAKVSIGIGNTDGIVPIYGIFTEEVPFLRAGDRVKAECVLNEGESPVTALPDDCIVMIGAEPAVFIKDEHSESKFFAIKVQPGISRGGWTEVNGLPENDDLHIVKEGAYVLKNALQQKSHGKENIGHFHSDGTFHEGEH